MRAGAEVFKTAIQAATPVGSRSWTRVGKYITTTHRAGQAKANVIIYERHSIRSIYGSYTPTSAYQYGLLDTISSPMNSLLIGYDKEHAYYMYWYEYGTMKTTKALTNIAYTTKTGKRRFRKRLVLTNWKIGQRARPFFRRTCDATMQAALNAAMDYLRDNVVGMGSLVPPPIPSSIERVA
jgi:hypothetical protein